MSAIKTCNVIVSLYCNHANALQISRNHPIPCFNFDLRGYKQHCSPHLLCPRCILRFTPRILPGEKRLGFLFFLHLQLNPGYNALLNTEHRNEGCHQKPTIKMPLNTQSRTRPRYLHYYTNIFSEKEKRPKKKRDI